jgi:Flp pilus assembly protein TadD
VARHEQALKLRPDSPGIHQNLGIALALSGQLPQAIEHFERALMLDPSFAEAHLALARALTDAGRLQEAAVHREKAQGLLGKRKP